MGKESYSNDNMLKMFQQVIRNRDRFNKTYGTRETSYLEQEQIDLTHQRALECFKFYTFPPPPAEATGFAARGHFFSWCSKTGPKHSSATSGNVCAHLRSQMLTGTTEKRAVFEAVRKGKRETITKEEMTHELLY